MYVANHIGGGGDRESEKHIENFYTRNTEGLLYSNIIARGWLQRCTGKSKWSDYYHISIFAHVCNSTLRNRLSSFLKIMKLGVLVNASIAEAVQLHCSKREIER